MTPPSRPTPDPGLPASSLADSPDPAAPALDPRGEARDGAGVAVGGYQPDPDLPAAPGWCEAIIAARPADKEPGGRLCFTKARYLRDGQRVCGLHARSHALVTRNRGL